MNNLTQGNAAKLYCLQYIRDYVVQTRDPVTILDLGCGVGLNFVTLLQTYPHVAYVGVEPSPHACAQARINLAPYNAQIIQSYAYNIDRKLREQFDFVVSFSVLEHVYRRLTYLQTARRCLKPKGVFLINYDSGHFFSGQERLSNFVGPLLARFGIERYYQSFVREQDFQRLLHKAGLVVEDQKVFNTSLKRLYKLLPETKRASFMQQWLALELHINSLGISYDDSQAPYFATRNFVLAAA